MNFKFLRNSVTITIYPQTILNICYYSKSISRRYLKILPVIKIGVFFTWFNFQNILNFFELFIDNWNFQFFWKNIFEVSIKFFWPYQNTWKFNTKLLLSYSYCYWKIMRIHRHNLGHNFFLLSFKDQILTKMHQNHE